MKNNWKQIFEGEYLDIWQTPKGKDGKSDFVLAVGGTHLFLNANTVFPELKIATDAVNREMSKPDGACYQWAISAAARQYRSTMGKKEK